MALLTRAVANARAIVRAQEWGDSSIPPNSAPLGLRGGQASSAGEAGALAIGTVLACVKALYDDSTVMPFKAFTGDRFGAHQPVRTQPLIVVEPFGPDLDPAEGFGQLVVSKAMRGNAYALVVDRDPDRPEFPTQLFVTHPDAVAPRRDPGTKRLYYTVGAQRVDAEDVVHLRGLMMPGADAGVDVLTYQRTTFDLAWNVNTYADALFRNGGSPAGVIAVPGKGDRGKAREVLDAWEGTHGGPMNAHRPAIMFGGATWTQLTITPENAQFLETRRFLREEICGLYSVPLQRIQAIVDNASQGGGKGLDAIDAGYVKHGLMPVHGGLERAWTRMIPGGGSTWAAFYYDEFLRSDAANRALIALQHRTAAIRTIDEIRGQDYGLPPLPNGAGADPQTPLNSNTGGADNAPAPGTIPTSGGGS